MDPALRIQLLRALVTDRQFLRRAAHDVRPEDFENVEETLVAELAVKFWDKYQDTVGPMLSSVASAEAAKRKLGTESRNSLKHLIRNIHDNTAKLVSVAALVDRVKELRQQHFWDEALDEILEAKEKGELTPQTLSDIHHRAGSELADANDFRGLDILASAHVEERIDRRFAWAEKQYPLIMIEPLDKKIRMPGKGHFAMFLAPPASGKGQALIHVSLAYALQGLNVLLFTLEDPKEEVEDRFDANLTGLPKTKLVNLPNKLRRRFKRAVAEIKGRIRVIDGTDGGWSVARIERTYEYLKREGFTADAIIVDYDDEIECDKKFTGESARRFEFAHIYRMLRQMAARLQVIVWTAAQTGKQAESKRVITGRDTAEDYSKIRKVFLCIGIGQDDTKPAVKHLYVIRHKTDRKHFGVDIFSDFSRAIFCHPGKTAQLERDRKAGKV